MNKYEKYALKCALIEVEELRINALLRLPALSPENPERYKVILNSIITGNDERINEKKQKRITLRRGICVAVLMIAILITMASCIKPIRDYFINIFEEYWSFTITDNSSNAEEGADIVYLPDSVPEGYELVDSSINGKSHETLWLNADGSFINLSQSSSDSLNVSIDNKGAEKDTVIIKGKEISVFKKNGQMLLIWSSDDYLFTLTCPESLSWEEIEALIVGIE